MIHAPDPSVTTDRVTPVSVCVAVTVTPGSTALLASVTRPASSAVACAQAGPAVSKRPNATTQNLRRCRCVTQSSTVRFECGLTPGTGEYYTQRAPEKNC